MHTFRNYVSTVCLLFIFLAAEINVFYLKVRTLNNMSRPSLTAVQALLWIPADHPLITIRLAFFAVWVCDVAVVVVQRH